MNAAESVILLLGLVVAGPPAPAQERRQAIEVPFRLTATSMLVDVVVNRRETAVLLFDTGWHATSLDSAFAARLELLAGAGGFDAGVRSLQLGPLDEQHVGVNLRNLAGLSPPGEPPVQGVLGTTFLSGRIVQIDFQKRVLRLLPEPAAWDTSSPTRLATAMHLTELGGLPIIDSIEVAGRFLRGMLDTGAGLSFLLTPTAKATLGLVPPADSPVRSGSYTGGSSRSGTASLLRLPRIRVGTITVDSPTVIIPGPDTPHLDQPLSNYGVIIGLSFLRRHLVTLDYRNRRVTIAPFGPEE